MNYKKKNDDENRQNQIYGIDPRFGHLLFIFTYL